MPVDQSQPTLRQNQLLKELRGCCDEMSGQQLYRALQDSPYAMGLATVYRNLRQLQQRGLVRCRHLPTGEALYAPVERDLHHLTCVDCGKTLPIQHCPLHNLNIPQEQSHNFQLIFHTLEFFGHCESCQKGQSLT